MSETKPLPKLGSLIDQESPVQNLTAAIRRKTIPHAFLFTGNEGVGKRTAAITFVMACNCVQNRNIQSSSETSLEKPTGSCGTCRSCLKIQSGNHPDVIFIKPLGATIKISQIRDLCDKLAVKPYEEGYRAVIISDAGKMNKEAGNALLKILEEPPGRTVIILTALQTSDLLPTVVSRCRQIRFSPISTENIRSFLTTTHGVDEDRASVIACMAGGSLSRALDMSRGNWLSVRQWIVDQVESFRSGRIQACLMFAERLARKKERVGYSLDILESWFRDLLVYPYVPERIVNKDIEKRVSVASAEMESGRLMSIIRAIHNAQKKIEANSNLRLTLEHLAIEIAGKGQ